MVPVRAALASGLIALMAGPAAARQMAVTPPEMEKFDQGFSLVQANTRTFQADVRQTLNIQGLSKPIISLGMLYFQAPDRLLIRFSQPVGEWMLVNGSQVAIQKQGQPLQRRDLTMQGKFPSHAASLLDFFHSGPDRWHKDFNVTMTRDGELIQVHLQPYLTPTAPSQGVDHVITTLRLPGYDLTEMQIFITADNRVDYQFQNGHRNGALDPALFKIPSG